MVNANGEFGPPDDYYEDDDDLFDYEDDYDPAYDFDDYGEEVDEFENDYDYAPTLAKRIRRRFRHYQWKLEDFVRSVTGARLRNRFRRCPECGKRNRAYWSYSDAVCSHCEIPF